MKINGFNIPAALEATLGQDNYKLSQNQTERLETALSRINGLDPELYGFYSIKRENELWTSKEVGLFLGTPSEQYVPGNVDPTLALIIGDAETDSPIALDYRTPEPRVICFCDFGPENYWVELSTSFEGFLKLIGSP